MERAFERQQRQLETMDAQLLEQQRRHLEKMDAQLNAKLQKMMACLAHVPLPAGVSPRPI